MNASASKTDAPGLDLALSRVARFPHLRALAWDDDVLYASHGYELLKAKIADPAQIIWEAAGIYSPSFNRRITASFALTSRLFRDGFHALSILPSKDLVAAVPGAIVTRRADERQFRVTHTITRGTRPLHITSAPGGFVYWGEYFDNPNREQVHIYASSDRGLTWSIAHTFAPGAVRHVHNIVYDPWGGCLWILTGDYGQESRIIRASYDFSRIDTILQGNQQARAVALVPMEEGLYFSTDTPLESNYVYRLDRGGSLTRIAPISSSSIYGCCVRGRVFFSTMVEPSEANPARDVHVYGGARESWRSLLTWRKDRWSMRFFQYGNAFLPDGNNGTAILAVSTIATKKDDQATTLYRVNS